MQSKNSNKTFFIKKRYIILLTFVVLSVLTIYYIKVKDEPGGELKPIIMHVNPTDNDISCHYVEEGDALSSASAADFSPSPDSIFFLETSCVGGLNSRKACAIESAARAHATRQVIVLFSAPVSDEVYDRSCVAVLRDLPNVMFARIHINDYTKDTPLEAMVAGQPFKDSQWRVEHTSDVLRLLTLYKWGGVYLDTDTMVVKPLTALGPNWVGTEYGDLVGSAVMAMSKDDIGRKFAEAVVNVLTIYYIKMEDEPGGELKPIIMHVNPTDNDISCHYVEEGDALSSASAADFSPSPDSIFFLETSCVGGLNSRKACAIESAARAHATRQVIVLFSAPVSDEVYDRSCVAVLRDLPNVMFARIHINDYTKDTPLEAMVAGQPFKDSKWRVEHTSDVLRLLTLYKWGGVYLDTDTMVVKPLTALGPNWVGTEFNNLVGLGAIAISKDDVGKKLAEAVINVLNIYYIKVKDEPAGELKPIIMHVNPTDNDISCHYVEEGDALSSASAADFSPSPDSIFFLETSCVGGLNSRKACAIESAARAHATRQVIVLFSAPVSDEVYDRSCVAVLRDLPNVMFARIHINDYTKDTPLEAMVSGQPFKDSQWRVEHTSDVLRLLTLYKWGGVYLDTDMMVVKPLTALGPNWVGKEHGGMVNAGAIAISMDDIGRKFAEAAINEVKTTFKPDIWTHNGPGAITRVLHKFCAPANVTDWSATTCQGLEVYSREYFYPIHYSRKNEYFKPGVLKNVEKAYTHHFWNKLTHDMEIQKGSPYAKLAEEFCPSIYEMYGDKFGS